GVPPEIEARFLAVDEARREHGTWLRDAHRTLVLVRDVATARRMAADRLMAGEEGNLGGIHHAAGRDRILPYLHRRPDEPADLSAIAAEGAAVSARDLPASRRVPLEELTG